MEQAELVSKLVLQIDKRVGTFAESTEEIAAESKVVGEMSQNIQSRLREMKEV